MGKLIVFILLGGFIYLTGTAIYEKVNATQTKTYGVATGYPSCGEYDCRVPVRWATGKETVELLQATRSMPVFGEVVTKVCYHYETMETDCIVKTTGQLSPDAN